MTTTAPTSAPRSGTGPAIAAILAISAAASLFLFWLIYIHPAAATSSQYAFLPALNAILNGLAAIALSSATPSSARGKSQRHRAAMITAFIFSTLFLVGYIAAPCAAWRRALPAPRRLPHLLSMPARQPHRSRRRGSASDPHHFLLLALGPLPAASQNRPLDFSSVALRLRHRRHHLRHAAPRARMKPA